MQDFDDFTSEHALHVHLGQRQIHRLVGSAATLQRAGLEACSSRLGHLKDDFSHASEHGLGLVAVGLVDTLGAALVGHGLHMLGALNALAFVDEDSQSFSRTIKTDGKLAGIGIMQWLGNFFEVGSLVHDRFFLNGQGKHQTTGVCLRRAGRGPILRIPKPKTVRPVGCTARRNYRKVLP